MATLNIISENQNIIESAELISPQVHGEKRIYRTNWFQCTSASRTPYQVQFGKTLVTLERGITKHNRPIRSAKGTTEEGNFFLAVFTEGTDPARPSMCGTITITGR